MLLYQFFWLSFVFNRDRVSCCHPPDGDKVRNWEQQISQVKQTFEKQLWSERTLKTQVRSAACGADVFAAWMVSPTTVGVEL